MRSPVFDASLAEAREYPQLWRLVLGLLLIAFFSTAFGAMIVGGLVAGAGLIDQSYTVHVTAALTRIGAAAQGYGGFDTPLSVFILLSTFVGFFLAPMLAAAAFHFRGPGSLFGEPPAWVEGFLTALAVLAPIYALAIGVSVWLDPTPLDPGLPFNRWLLLLPLAVPLIFIQTGAEELVFRGYVQQQLAARFQARWIWMGLPSLIFGLLHWMPEAGANLPLVLASAFVFGLIAADLTEQTGSLGAAMGIHFGNNLVAMLGVGTADTITGLALYVTPVPVSATGANSIAMVLSVGVLVLVWWVTRRRLAR